MAETNTLYLFTRNFCTGTTDTDGLKIVDYKLELERTRNKYDVPYGNCPGGKLKVRLDIGNINDCKKFYEDSCSDNALTYSLLFQTPDADNIKNDGLLALIFEGYIVGIEESYVRETVIVKKDDATTIIRLDNLSNAALLDSKDTYTTSETVHLYLDVEFLITYSSFINGQSVKNYQFSN